MVLIEIKKKRKTRNILSFSRRKAIMYLSHLIQVRIILTPSSTSLCLFGSNLKNSEEKREFYLQCILCLCMCMCALCMLIVLSLPEERFKIRKLPALDCIWQLHEGADGGGGDTSRFTAHLEHTQHVLGALVTR